jgi:hypothetical protein
LFYRGDRKDRRELILCGLFLSAYPAHPALPSDPGGLGIPGGFSSSWREEPALLRHGVRDEHHVKFINLNIELFNV